jgi:hypothetical protein
VTRAYSVENLWFDFVVEEVQPRSHRLAMGVAKILEHNPTWRGLVSLARADLSHLRSFRRFNQRLSMVSVGES